MRLRASLVALSILAAPALLPAGAAFATDYYVAPLGTVQSCTADGSQACPWTSLSTALKSTKFAGGDRFLLLDGNYGGLTLYQYVFPSPVTVQSLNGKNAHLDWINITDGTQNIVFRNLSIWPSDPSVKVSPLIAAKANSSYIVLDGLDIRGVQASANYMNWSQTDWLTYAASGADLRGPYSTIENSSFLGVDFGPVVEGANSALIGNRVDGYAGDSYRALGNNTLVSGNYSQNCFKVDDNHMDGLQSWVTSGPVTGMTVENNTFIEWNSPVVNPLRCALQGIGFFDGPYQDLIIRNNVISTAQYHGISVYGGINVKILNNTVVNNNGIEGSTPWIGVWNNKDGTPPQNVLVANNLAMSVGGDATSGVTFVNNSTLMGLSTVFQNIATFDYRPTSASGFIDTGDVGDAPPTDIVGAARPYGAGPDRGAYEISGTSGGTTTPPPVTTPPTTTPPPTWTPRFLRPPKKS